MDFYDVMYYIFEESKESEIRRIINKVLKEMTARKMSVTGEFFYIVIVNNFIQAYDRICLQWRIQLFEVKRIYAAIVNTADQNSSEEKIL